VKGLGSYFFSVVMALLVLAAVAPVLIGLSHALVPVLVVGGVAIVVIRLVFFHTRRW
jgi:predicted membrane channel-forming protein YqfA (hemolysin III family)